LNRISCSRTSAPVDGDITERDWTTGYATTPSGRHRHHHGHHHRRRHRHNHYHHIYHHHYYPTSSSSTTTTTTTTTTATAAATTTTTTIHAARVCVAGWHWTLTYDRGTKTVPV
jgi:hypothetical protein